MRQQLFFYSTRHLFFIQVIFLKLNFCFKSYVRREPLRGLFIIVMFEFFHTVRFIQFKSISMIFFLFGSQKTFPAESALDDLIEFFEKFGPTDHVQMRRDNQKKFKVGFQ